MEWKRLGCLLLTTTVLILSLLEYRRELGQLGGRRSLMVKVKTTVPIDLAQDQGLLTIEDYHGVPTEDDVLAEDESSSRFSSGSEDDELGLETGSQADPGILATLFMFGLPEELIRIQILLRIYERRDGRTTSVSALHMLCVLHLVCKRWRSWIDNSPDWLVARNLFAEDALAMNEELRAELGDTEDEEEELSF
jgi:hypothetical protein